MYIYQRNYTLELDADDNEDSFRLVLILPSEPHLPMSRFKELIIQCTDELNKEREGRKWMTVILNHEDGLRTRKSNFDTIYRADVIVAECSKRKPNVFYLAGLAHACGKPVCFCYCNEDEIPFNVHGRQSLRYSIAEIAGQESLLKNIKEWLLNYECKYFK